MSVWAPVSLAGFAVSSRERGKPQAPLLVALDPRFRGGERLG
jgi:hypothetical protein